MIPESFNEHCACPYCKSDDAEPWAEENGYFAVRCTACDFLYVNPRPNSKLRNRATELGVHEAAGNMVLTERHLPTKVAQYAKIIQKMFPEFATRTTPLSWTDVGAGYGEVMQAVQAVAPENSVVRGIEPMKAKADAACAAGLDVRNEFIGPDTPKSEHVSLINVFSHINEFDEFVEQLSGILLPRGEILIETGDMTLVRERNELPGPLDLPDHVVFAGHNHITGFLKRHGFEIVMVQTERIDGLIYTAKNIAKKLLGRNVRLALPHQSPYRTMFVRARKLN
jgi:Zn ribbon nucleic-acid-binding protein